VTKPNLADGANNLELEATTEAIASDEFRLHDVVSWPAASRGMIVCNDLLPFSCPRMTRSRALSVSLSNRADNLTLRTPGWGSRQIRKFAFAILSDPF
jgi:hypothetical protein